ncbi:hypothetical protein G7043_47175 [Lentzea sp. NEAU-D13]|uniref:DUF5808 domain-containing protein n=1 Tax=Lentzea alba TaxID=2714351 RepID=A0A7C9RYZ5_9PSEU|nr:DUF5808 domain-containing protein [Lentzea alba]NGY66489.1 hypothetical protein [Lentzea alba]
MTILWTVIITAGFLAMPALARPTLPFGIRVPRERLREPVLRTVRNAYRAGVALLGAAAVVVSIGGVSGLVPPLVMADLLFYWAASAALARAKRLGEWTSRRQGVASDTSLRTDPVRLAWLFLLPATAFLVATAVLGLVRYSTLPTSLPTFTGLAVDAHHRIGTTPWTAAWPVTHQLVVLVLAVLVVVVLPRSRPELDAARPAASARRYRAYLTGMLRIVVLVATAVNAALTVIALQMWTVVTPSSAWTVLAAAPVAAAFAAALVWMARTGDVGHRLADEDEEDSGLSQRDDDRYWHVGGTVYANRADPALLVHQRVGMRWTLNLGHPMSWLILAALAAVAISAATGLVHLPSR